MNPLFYTADQLRDFPALTFGGKANGLRRLAESGAAVPPFVVIPAEIAETRPWHQDDAGREALLQWFDRLNTAPFQGVAVRSSADTEDQATVSGAGVFETIFVKEASALFSALDQVCDSVRHAAAQAHAARTHRAPRMAVILQACVPSHAAGVLFSAHPARAHPERCYVEAVHGAGENLVDGSRTPSRFLIDLASGNLLESNTAPSGPDTLSAAAIRQFIETLLAAERQFNAPLDIEWAMDEAGVWFLQARPMTALEPDPALRPPECATSWFFDQRFLRPISPFTRSTLLPLILKTGVLDALAMRRRVLTEPMRYFFGGQVYVPHRAYRAMFAGAPWWWLSADLRQLFPPACACGAPTPGGNVFDYAWCSARAVWRYRRDVFRNIGAWDRFREELSGNLAATYGIRLNEKTKWLAAWNRMDNLSQRFLEIHRWSILWAGYFFRAFNIVKRVLPHGMAEKLETRLWRETRLVTAEANAALAQATAEDIPGARENLIARYGHRSVSLDYASPTWAELAEDGALFDTTDGRPPAHETSAAKTWWLYPVRRFLEMREEQRFEWERILARQRQMALEAGTQLAVNGSLAAQDDVWFLSWEELLGTLFDNRPPPASAVQLRRHAATLEQRFDKPPFLGPAPVVIPISSSHLQGLGASPGVVRGCVWRLQTLEETMPDIAPPVIAVATALDPAHTALLARVQGVVLERGGLLSHAAVLAREYRVPLVIGAEGALQRLSAGVEITIDGATGTIRIHDGGPG